jgi:hypothetical protein
MRIDTIEEIGIEVKAEKTKFMLLSRYQNAGHNHDTKITKQIF